MSEEKNLLEAYLAQRKESSVEQKVSVFPTGFPTLDNDLLGVGGIPRNRFITFYGPPMSGKTTMALHVIANAQKQGLEKPPVFLDPERAFSKKLATDRGVDLDNLLLIPDEDKDNESDSFITGERFVDLAVAAAQAGHPLVVIDSAAALVPQAQLEGDAGSSFMGKKAQLQTRLAEKMAYYARPNQSTVIIINHEMTPFATGGYGIVLKRQAGAEALKYYASTVIRFRPHAALKQNDEKIGCIVELYIEKHKVAPPFKSAEFNMINDVGFDTGADMCKYCLEHGIMRMDGQKITYGEHNQRIAQKDAKLGKQFLEFWNSLGEVNQKEILQKIYP